MNQIKKYKTKPIDHTGINLVIVDHLNRGLAIECWCWDEVYDNGRKGFVSFIDTNDPYLYGSVNGSYSNADPIEIKTVLRKKKASEIVKWLEDNGYVYKDGSWVSWRIGMQDYSNNIFLYCGAQVYRPASQAPTEWYEEVEK